MVAWIGILLSRRVLPLWNIGNVETPNLYETVCKTDISTKVIKKLWDIKKKITSKNKLYAAFIIILILIVF